MPQSHDRAPDPRRVADAQTMRALTHPTRIALIETLTLHGPLTATEAAELVDESPSSCSFHLRQLARYGFVEEAGGGTGRRRPWKMTNLGMTLASVHDDAATEVAHEALTRLVRERQLTRLDRWWRTRASYPRAWREAELDNEHLIWLTADELRALSERLTDELRGLRRDRLEDPSRRPEGALPVELLLFGYPMTPPEGA